MTIHHASEAIGPSMSPDEAAAASRKDDQRLGQRAAKGAVVTIGAQIIRILLQVISVSVLARMLLPHDYGLVAMVTAVTGIAEIFRDFGLSSAAVQARTLSRSQRDNLFWVNSGIGAVLAIIVFFSAGLIADLYGEPALIPLTHILAATYLINGMATQYRADLTRRMAFRSLAVADVLGPVAGLIAAVIMAKSGAGPGALVAQQIGQAGTLLVALILLARWLPHLPSRAPMGGLLRFGWNLVATQLVGYAANNVDSLVIGARFGAAPLGHYNRAFQLLMTPLNQLRAPTTTVALPVLSRLDNNARYSAFIKRGQLALGYTLIAGLAVVIGTARPLTDVFLGERWGEVSTILLLLAAAGIFQTLAYVGYWIYLSKGLTGDLLRYTLLTSTIKVTCIVTGSQFGLIGVAAGYAIAPALAWPLSLWWLSRRTVVPMRDLARQALRILAVAAATAATTATVTHAMSAAWAPLSLTAGCLTGLATYAIAALVVPAVRRDIVLVIATGRLAVSRGRR